MQKKRIRFSTGVHAGSSVFESVLETRWRPREAVLLPESFGSLQFVLVGAEKLPDRVALAFEDTFGIRPLEGYGCT